MDIYKITNIVNGKIYIGKTEKTYLERWEEHKRNAKYGNISHLYNAMRKYGIDKFIIIDIDSASTINELNNKEKYWIAKLHATDPEIGYNIALGGDGGNTFIGMSEEEYSFITNKMSESASNKITINNG